MLRERRTVDDNYNTLSNIRNNSFARSGGRNYISLLIIILSIILVLVFINRIFNSHNVKSTYSSEDIQRWGIFKPKQTYNDDKYDENVNLEINFNKHLEKQAQRNNNNTNNNNNNNDDHDDNDDNDDHDDNDKSNNTKENKLGLDEPNKHDSVDNDNDHQKKSSHNDNENEEETVPVVKASDIIHVHVTKDHNMALRHWYASVLKGILPRKGVNLFHFDTHSDLHLPFDGIDYSDDDPMTYTKQMAKKHKILIKQKTKKKRKKKNIDGDDDDDDDDDDNDNDNDGRDDRRKKARIWSNPWYFPNSFEEATDLCKHLEIGNFIPHSFNNGLVSSMTWVRPEWGDPNTFMQPSIGKHLLNFGYDKYGHYCVDSKEWEKEGQNYCNQTSMSLSKPVTIRAIKFPDLLKVAMNSSEDILHNLVDETNPHIILDIDYDFLSTVDPDFPGYVKKGLKADFMFKWDSISRACYNAKCCSPKTKRQYSFMWRYVRALFRARHDNQINTVYDKSVHRIHWIKKENRNKPRKRNRAISTRASKRRNRKKKKNHSKTKLERARSKRLEMCHATKIVFFKELWKLRRRMSYKQARLMLSRLSSDHHDLEESIIGSLDGFFSVDPTYVAELEEIQDRLRDMAKFLSQPSIGSNIRVITVTRSREWLPRGFLSYAEHGILDMLKASLKKVNRKVKIHFDTNIKYGLSDRPGDCNAKPPLCYDLNFFLSDTMK